MGARALGLPRAAEWQHGDTPAPVLLWVQATPQPVPGSIWTEDPGGPQCSPRVHPPRPGPQPWGYLQGCWKCGGWGILLLGHRPPFIVSPYSPCGFSGYRTVEWGFHSQGLHYFGTIGVNSIATFPSPARAVTH